MRDGPAGGARTSLAAKPPGAPFGLFAVAVGPTATDPPGGLGFPVREPRNGPSPGPPRGDCTTPSPIVTPLLGARERGHARTGFRRQPYDHVGKRFKMDPFTTIDARSAELLP